MRANNPSRYQVYERIGSGGMGEVYRGTLAGPGGVKRIVALKMIQQKHLSNETVAQMFFTEARLSFVLVHPNIVQTFELGEMGDQYFLVSEYVDGYDLSVVLRSVPKLPAKICTYIVNQILRGLVYAHSLKSADDQPLNVVHRDLSPCNILVSKQGQVKITDFGLAKSLLQSRQSIYGELKGKIAYMSPEQLRGEVSIDTRSDLYSLALLYMEMLSGQPVFDLSTLSWGEPRPEISARLFDSLSNIPPELKTLLRSCLSDDITQRPESSEILARQLDVIVRQYDMEISEFEFMDYLKSIESTLTNPKNPLDPFNEALEKNLNLRGQTLISTPASPHIPSEVAALTLGPPKQPTVSDRQNDLSSDNVGSQRRRWPVFTMIAVLCFLTAGALGIFFLGKQPENQVPQPRPDQNKAATNTASQTQLSPENINQSSESDNIPSSISVSTDIPSPKTESTQSTAKQTETRKITTAKNSEQQKSTKSPKKTRRAKTPTKKQHIGRAKDEKTQSKKAKGALSVNTSPWSIVYIDGKRIRGTPLINHKISAGVHRLRLKNKDRHIDVTKRVRIEAGKTKRLILDLENATFH